MSDTPNTIPESAGAVPPELHKNVILTTLDNIYNWGRARSMWPMAFGLACCAIEYMAVSAARFDLARFGMEIMRPSPRQADLMIVSGTVTKKMVPNIVRLYNQMAEPKYVMAMGACATSGGPFKEGYNVVSGIDKFIPVDIYVPGCPPTPEAFLYGVMKIHEKVFKQSIRTAPWYKKDQLNDPIPVPVLGPDLLDVRQRELVKAAAAKTKAAAEATAAEAAASAPPAAASAPAPAPGTRLSPEELERRRAEARARKAAEATGTLAAPAPAQATPPAPAPAAAQAGGRLSPEELERRRAEARARKAAAEAAAGGDGAAAETPAPAPAPVTQAPAPAPAPAPSPAAASSGGRLSPEELERRRAEARARKAAQAGDAGTPAPTPKEE